MRKKDTSRRNKRHSRPEDRVGTTRWILPGSQPVRASCISIKCNTLYANYSIKIGWGNRKYGIEQWLWWTSCRDKNANM